MLRAMTTSTIGEFVSQARHRAGLDQADLAARRNVTRTTQAGLEAAGANPTVATLTDLARALGAGLTIRIDDADLSGYDQITLAEPAPSPQAWIWANRDRFALLPGRHLADGEACRQVAVTALVQVVLESPYFTTDLLDVSPPGRPDEECLPWPRDAQAFQTLRDIAFRCGWIAGMAGPEVFDPCATADQYPDWQDVRRHRSTLGRIDWRGLDLEAWASAVGMPATVRGLA